MNSILKKKTRAVLLMSGGLDSILAAKLLLEQGVEVAGICFYSNFFGCDLARKAAEQIGIALKEVDISEDIIQILKKPKHGYGSAINPCIDCHTLMLKRAGKIMKEEKFCFVATGEVLNERPMSQNKRALKIVEEEAGLKGYLLRPLSAKLLEPTILENRGIVIRDKLMDISGRSRKRQMELANKFGIKEYPTPAGGCMLTQKGFAKRLKELMERDPDFNRKDAELIKIGRHFWIDGFDRLTTSNAQIILGRNKEENEQLIKLAGENDIMIEPDGFIGPTAVIILPLSFRAQASQTGRSRGIPSASKSDAIIEKAKELIVQFSPKANGLKNFQFSILQFPINFSAQGGSASGGQ